MLANIRNRILHFLQLTHCHYRIEDHKVVTAAAVLSFFPDYLLIERPGKPERLMPYSKLNLDRLFLLINSQAPAPISRHMLAGSQS